MWAFYRILCYSSTIEVQQPAGGRARLLSSRTMTCFLRRSQAMGPRPASAGNVRSGQNAEALMASGGPRCSTPARRHAVTAIRGGAGPAAAPSRPAVAVPLRAGGLTNQLPSTALSASPLTSAAPPGSRVPEPPHRRHRPGGTAGPMPFSPSLPWASWPYRPPRCSECRCEGRTPGSACGVSGRGWSVCAVPPFAPAGSGRIRARAGHRTSLAGQRADGLADAMLSQYQSPTSRQGERRCSDDPDRSATSFRPSKHPLAECHIGHHGGSSKSSQRLAGWRSRPAPWRASAAPPLLAEGRLHPFAASCTGALHSLCKTQASSSIRQYFSTPCSSHAQ